MSSRFCLRTGDGTVVPLPWKRWLGSATPEEELLLERALPPVLDVGCGPGRHVLALARRGIFALGVDAAPLAVRIASERGAQVLRGSIFQPMPGSGTWGSALLLDGNVGIGGNPETLLHRIRQLLRGNGRVLVEVDAPGTPTGPVWLSVENGSTIRDRLPWARLGADRLHDLATRTGFRLTELSILGYRWFGVLERR